MAKVNMHIIRTVSYMAFASILIFGWGSSANCQTRQSTGDQAEVRATIQGKITDSKGTPIQEAIITTVPPTKQVISRSDGSYIIPGIAAGTYWVTAKERGGKQVSRTRIHVVTPSSSTVDGIQLTLRTTPTLEEQWQQRRNGIVTALALFPFGTFIGLSIADSRLSESTDEARTAFESAVPISPGDYLTRGNLWEEFQKMETREDWMRVTSLNLLVDALPFYWYSVKGRRIDNKAVVLYYGSQAVIFGTWALIDFDRSNDAETLSDAFSDRIQFHEATEEQGKKARLRERAKWLAINAALDVGIGYLYWRIIPRSTNRELADLQWSTQFANSRVGISISGAFR